MSLRFIKRLLIVIAIVEVGLSVWLIWATVNNPALEVGSSPKLEIPEAKREKSTDAIEFDYAKLKSLRLQRPLFDPPPEPVVETPPPPIEPPRLRVLATFTGQQAQAMLENEAGGTYIKSVNDEFDVDGGTVKITGVTANSVKVLFQEKEFDLSLETGQ